MQEVAKNEYYELSYDKTLNRIYWTMRGFWKNVGLVPDFVKDWDNALKMTHSGFNVCADLTKLSPMPTDVKELNDKTQQKIMAQGCTKVACIVESATTKMSLNAVIKESGMEKMVQYFSSNSDAKKWLAE